MRTSLICKSWILATIKLIPWTVRFSLLFNLIIQLTMLLISELKCLVHLRELNADGNLISSLDGLAGMADLARLSLKGNRLPKVDLTEYQW